MGITTLNEGKMPSELNGSETKDRFKAVKSTKSARGKAPYYRGAGLVDLFSTGSILTETCSDKLKWSNSSFQFPSGKHASRLSLIVANPKK